MKRMPLSRLFALPLALTLLLSPAAQALTPNQARELLQDYYIDEVPEDVLDPVSYTHLDVYKRQRVFLS